MQGNKFISSTCLNKLDTFTMLTDDHVFDALGPFGRVPRTKDLRGILTGQYFIGGIQIFRGTFTEYNEL